MSRRAVLVSSLAVSLAVAGSLIAPVAADAQRAANLYVATSGTATTGCTRVAACSTVQQAADAASRLGAVDVVVHIAPGTYTGTASLGDVPAGHTLTLLGAGARKTTLDGGGQQTLTMSTGALVIDGLTLTHGSGVLSGGDDVLIVSSVLTGNTGTLVTTNSDYTGGSALLTIRGTTVAGNTLGQFDVDVRAGIAGSLVIDRSTFVGAAGSTAVRNGGAGARTSAGTTTVRDSTFVGSGVDATPTYFIGSPTTITGSTFDSAEVLGDDSGDSTITGSIVSGAPRCAGFVDGGYNVDSGSTCGFGATSVSNSATIGLRPLAANGSRGPRTEAIGPTSSAHDLVPSAYCDTTDERGVARTGDHCDAGAYEYVPRVR